uniref:Uncharacterized protein n=1 Tax=Anopheles coluzzii TaxID=1518534 RepID=A0A6E8WC18_ANOCL
MDFITSTVRSVLRSRIQQNGELFASSSVRNGGNAKTCAQITLMRDAVISRKIPIIIQSPDIALSRHKEERSCHLQTPSHRLHKRDVDHRLEDVRSLDCPNQAACCTRLHFRPSVQRSSKRFPVRATTTTRFVPSRFRNIWSLKTRNNCN